MGGAASLAKPKDIMVMIKIPVRLNVFIFIAIHLLLVLATGGLILGSTNLKLDTRESQENTVILPIFYR